VNLVHDLDARLGATAAADLTEVPFTMYDIQSCLLDARRVRYLRDAIMATVKPGDVVVDAGSGTGLLGMFAAEAGAQRVYCLEFSHPAIPVITENARRNGLADRIVAVHTNAAYWEPPSGVNGFDVIISEVISAGFYYEPQLQILNHLRSFLKPGGSIVPMAMENYVELLDAQDMLYGFRFNYDTRFKGLPGDTAVSSRASYHVANFYRHNTTDISASVTLRAPESAVANAVRISYDVTFAPGIVATEPTDFLLNPQIIFLPSPVKLRAGVEYRVGIAYTASSSPLTSAVTVEEVLH
jgi:predicted RNA methylase